jgi:hypothetical protein
LAKINPEDARL